MMYATFPRGCDRPEAKVEPVKPDELPERKIIVVQPADSSSLGQILRAVEPILEPLATGGLVVILVIFMLVKREDLRTASSGSSATGD